MKKLETQEEKYANRVTRFIEYIQKVEKIRLGTIIKNHFCFNFLFLNLFFSWENLNYKINGV